MGNPAIFSGRRTKLLTADGILNQNNSINDNDGIKNYIANGHGELTVTTGWATYANAAGTSPVNGTGGAPSVTWTRTTTSPLAGQGSFLFTKGASNLQGNGASYDFTIDTKDKAKVLQISMDYIISSGTFVAGSPGVAADLTVWIYDITNAVLIQPSSISFLSSSTTISDRFNATFQTASNSTSYRLIIHVGTVSALAYTIMYDNVTVSPSTYVYGTPVTDWAAYVPTGGWSTNTTYTGFWRRVGKNLEYRVRVALAGAPTSASLTINYLPSGLSADTTALTSSATDGTMQIGSGVTKSAGSLYDVSVYYNGTTSAAPIVKVASGTYTSAASNISQILPATYASGDSVDIWGSVPILGWSSSVQTSDQTDTRVVAARVSKTGNQTGVNPNNTFVKITLDTTLDGDTHGMLDAANNRLVAKVPGWYDFSGYTYFGGTNVLANLYIGAIYKNGSLHSQGSAMVATVGTSFGVLTSGKIYLNSGDYVELYIYGQGNNSVSTLTASIINLSISRISGPNQITATETVAWKYYDVASTSYPNGPTTMTFGTKEFDTHGIVTSSTATIPISGKYMICGKHRGAGNQTSNFELKMQVYKNSSTLYLLSGQSFATAGVQNYGVNGCTTLQLLAGDTIALRFTTTAVANQVSSAIADECVFEGYRIGN